MVVNPVAFCAPVPRDVLARALLPTLSAEHTPVLPSRAIDRREGLSDVSRLFGKDFDARSFPERPPDCIDQVAQSDGLRMAQVIKVMARTAFDRADDPVDDVANVGIIPAAGAVTEHRHRQALVDQPGKLRDREIRAIAWAIGREEPQSRHRQSVQVVKRVGQELAGPSWSRRRG